MYHALLFQCWPVVQVAGQHYNNGPWAPCVFWEHVYYCIIWFRPSRIPEVRGEPQTPALVSGFICRSRARPIESQTPDWRRSLLAQRRPSVIAAGPALSRGRSNPCQICRDHWLATPLTRYPRQKSSHIPQTCQNDDFSVGGTYDLFSHTFRKPSSASSTCSGGFALHLLVTYIMRVNKSNLQVVYIELSLFQIEKLRLTLTFAKEKRGR